MEMSDGEIRWRSRKNTKDYVEKIRWKKSGGKNQVEKSGGKNQVEKIRWKNQVEKFTSGTDVPAVLQFF